MRGINFDKLGASASTICLVHCTILPLVLSLFPLLALKMANFEIAEIILFISAIIFGIFAACYGYKKHKGTTPLLLLSSGILCLILGRLTDNHNYNIYHIVVMVIAGIFLVCGHFINNKLCNSCHKCTESTCIK